MSRPPCPEPTNRVASAVTAVQSSLSFVVGGNETTMQLFNFDTATGAAVKNATVDAAGSSPDWFALSNPTLPSKPGAKDFFVVLGGSDQVASFHFDPTIPAKPAALAVNQRNVTSGGQGPAHMGVSPDGKWALVANYNSGQTGVFEVENKGGKATLKEKPTTVVDHKGGRPLGPRKDRQDGSHPHEIFFPPSKSKTETNVMIPDLGTDTLMQFTLNTATGSMTAGTPIPFQPGTGPRHVLTHPRLRNVAYVVGELASTVTVLNMDPATGFVAAKAGANAKLPASFAKQTISALAPGDKTNNTTNGKPNTAAELIFSEDGATLYVSVRGPNIISMYNVDATTGALTQAGTLPTNGLTPRYFTFDPTNKFLLVCNSDSNSVAIFKKESAVKFTKLSSISGVTGAQALQFL